MPIIAFQAKLHNDTNIVRTIKDHDCELNPDEDVVASVIHSGSLVLFRRWIYRRITIDHRNPMSKVHFKSTQQIDEEMTRHLRHHSRTIHPFSLFKHYWICVMAIVYPLTFAIVPLEVSAPLPEQKLFLILVKFLLDVICWMDMIIRFNTGIFDERWQRTVLNKKMIAKRYLLGFFIVDLVASAPISLLLYLEVLGATFLQPILFVRLARFGTARTYIYEVFDRYNFPSTSRLLILVVYFFIVYILNGCAWNWVFVQISYYMNGFDLKAEFSTIILFKWMFTVTEMLSQMDPPFIRTTQTELMLLNIVWIYIGFFVGLFILCRLVEIYCLHNDTNNKFLNLKTEIDKYLKFKGLSRDLVQKVERFLLFKYQRNVGDDRAVMKDLSHALYREIISNSCKEFVEKVEIFRDFPEDVVYNLVSSLRMDVYITNDVIFQAGMPGNSMFFIYSGRVAVYTKTEREVCHLGEGSYFGEIALLINMMRTATVVAITECELYRLNRKDFMEAIDPHPEIKQRMEQLAVERLKEMDEMTGSYSNHNDVFTSKKRSTIRI